MRQQARTASRIALGRHSTPSKMRCPQVESPDECFAGANITKNRFLRAPAVAEVKQRRRPRPHGAKQRRRPRQALEEGLTDRYGLSWQIIPSVLGKLLQSPDAEKSNRSLGPCPPWTSSTSGPCTMPSTGDSASPPPVGPHAARDLHVTAR
jgi:hypothetical protein